MRGAIELARRLPDLGDSPSRGDLWALVREYGLKGAVPHALNRALTVLPGRRHYVQQLLQPQSSALYLDMCDSWAWKQLDGPRWWAFLADLVTSSRERTGHDYFRHRAVLAGIENGHPLLDDLDLVELVLRLPPELAFDRELTRPVLRRAVTGVVPDEVRLRQDKVDFSVLVVDALNGPDRPIVEELLGAADAELFAYVVPEKVRSLLDTPLERRHRNLGPAGLETHDDGGVAPLPAGPGLPAPPPRASRPWRQRRRTVRSTASSCWDFVTRALRTASRARVSFARQGSSPIGRTSRAISWPSTRKPPRGPSVEKPDSQRPMWNSNIVRSRTAGRFRAHVRAVQGIGPSKSTASAVVIVVCQRPSTPQRRASRRSSARSRSAVRIATSTRSPTLENGPCVHACPATTSALVTLRERRDALDAENRGNRLVEQLLRRRPVEPARPVRMVVDLDPEREPGQLEWEPVRAHDVRLGVSDLDEAGLEEGSLHRVRVDHEHVEVDERPERGIRISRSDVGALVEDDRPVARAPHCAHDLGSDERREHVQSLGVLELGRNRLSELAPAPSREQMEAVGAQRGEIGCAVYQPVDRGPDRRASVVDDVGIRCLGRDRAYHPDGLDGSTRRGSP